MSIDLPVTKSDIKKFAPFIAENNPKISSSGQTCGQVRKMGLFNPRSREEQARSIYYENARFQEILRGNKRKIGTLTNPDFGLM